MKPVGPEQTQDIHEHDYIALYVSNLKKYKRMKKKQQNIDKQTRDLIRKSVLKPTSPNFDALIMQKISLVPRPSKVNSNGFNLRKAWILLILAITFFLSSILLISQFSVGYLKNISPSMLLIANYIYYGGIALFVPLVLYHFDALIQASLHKNNQKLTPA
ncbi:MAG: hypothetical protein MI975_10630 [Cytophagales bacterium]|nr:hypothetical protein [Cytophagales bacterium]